MIEVSLGALVRERRVLLARRSTRKRALPGAWDLPGGVVEAAETPVEALVRELREELGVEVDPAAAPLLCEVTVVPAGDAVRLRAWLVPTWQGDPVNAAPEEHDDLRWYAADELPPLAHPSVREALVAALR